NASCCGAVALRKLSLWNNCVCRNIKASGLKFENLLESECAYTVLVVAVFWLSEAMPLAITALIPALMFPLFGIVKSKDVANSYFKDFHLLLTGVICLATSIEKWNLHKRIALQLVMVMGVNPGRLMMGFMLSCAFLSMWLSNTSTAAMVMPIVEAVTQQIINAEAEVHAGQENGVSNRSFELNGIVNLEKQSDNQLTTSRKDHKLCKGISLCVAFSSTIGGLSTITGTSTNLIFVEQFNTDVNFGSWFVLVFPMSVIILILSWVWLHAMFCGFDFKSTLICRKAMSNKEKASIKVIQDEYKKLGPMRYQEIITLILFCLMAILWFTREPGFFPGWSSLFSEGFATDSTVALLLGLLFFILPLRDPRNQWLLKDCGLFYVTEKGYSALITWSEFQATMPWDICFLVGGGFALAEGCEISGLSLWVGSKLEPLGSLPVLVIILISSLIVTTVTEVASNPATITIFLPILAPLAEAIHVNPLYLLIPTTLCTSFAFLLPVSNPPNAIVFGYGHVTMMDMVSLNSCSKRKLFSLDHLKEWGVVGKMEGLRERVQGIVPERKTANVERK
uniref:Solute carrier family 13 member 1 n=1 Tax=Callorhinchus milii TaxID=7868 RepID=A0A4W3K8P7_CALMI